MAGQLLRLTSQPTGWTLQCWLYLFAVLGILLNYSGSLASLQLWRSPWRPTDVLSTGHRLYPLPFHRMGPLHYMYGRQRDAWRAPQVTALVKVKVNDTETMRRPDLSQAELVRLARMSIAGATSMGKTAVKQLRWLAHDKGWADGRRRGRRFVTELHQFYQTLLEAVRYCSMKDLYHIALGLVQLQTQNTAFATFLEGPGYPLVDTLSYVMCNAEVAKKFPTSNAAQLALALGKLHAEPHQVLNLSSYVYALAINTTESSHDFCVLLRGMAWAKCTSSPFPSHLARHLIQPAALQELGAKDVLGMVWALGELGITDERWMRQLGDVILERRLLHRYRSQDLLLLLRTFAISGIHHRPLFDGIADQLLQPGLLHTLHHKRLTTVAWAFASLGHRHVELLTGVAEQLADSDKLHRLGVTRLLTLTWSYGTLTVFYEGLFLQLAATLQDPNMLTALDGTAVIDLFWAFAVLQFRDVVLLEKLGQHLLSTEYLDGANSSDFVRLAWACTALSWPQLMNDIAVQIRQPDILPHCSPQEMSTIAWAFATLGIHDTALMPRLSARLRQVYGLSNFTVDQLSTILWSFARLDITDQPLMTAIATHIMTAQILSTCTPQSIAHLTWAFATLGVADDELFLQLGHHAIRHDLCPQFTSSQLSAITWAYTTAHVSHPEFLKCLSDLANETTSKP